MTARRSAPSDQADRVAAVAERELNVLIDAGAGTGKTTIVVERLIELVAPQRDAAVPLRMDRIAAVTFTRRAAGELRLRLRERLLRELADGALSVTRASRLRGALGALDVAYVGTIHAFADRLLRLHPVEAQLSPSFTIADDDELLRETFERLVTSAEAGTLEAELAGAACAARAQEAERTVLDVLRAGVRAESQELEFTTRYGLDALVETFVRKRDVPPPDPSVAPFDRAAFESASADIQRRAGALVGSSTGARWLRNLGELLERLGGECDPIVLYAELGRTVASFKDATLRDDFEGDTAAWQVWKLFTAGAHKKVELPRPLRDELLAPFRRWLTTRVVRLFPVIVALHEQVKARHQAVDSIDLLLKLRDLLARDLRVRRQCQQRFDHVFVDEFQDTDPLQAEVLLFLCERRPVAQRAADVEIADGKLTVVGDPKQSIYRFRRADIAMYERVRAKIGARRHRAVKLSANFRSTPPLIEWFNDRFSALLGAPPKKGQPAFSAETGDVAYQPLRRGRTDGQSVAIHVVPFCPDGESPKANEYRELEAEVLARYLRWLVERSDVEVLDTTTRERRAVTYADVAVLVLETTNVRLLFPRLDELGIPHSARGGTLFLQDPLHRQFLLGLRAIADREDGVAQAALHRPPFFSIDVADLVEDTEAARAAKEILVDLRARRHARAPGATARDLLERTGFGRAVAIGPNGVQRLERLYELCLALEVTAEREGLDYDGVTAQMRRWIDAPIKMDAPHPVAADAIQIMTVHQAKGLEFPVVVLWDGRAGMGGRPDNGPWYVTADQTAWQLALDGLAWEEPEGAALLDKERRYRDAERKRLIYVAATRARDLLVLPKAGAPGAKHVAGVLLAGEHEPMALELRTYRPSKPPVWARGIAPPAEAPLVFDDEAERRIGAAWRSALAVASAPSLAPIGVAAAAHPARGGPDAPGGATPRSTPGRYGPVFGETVHRAIERVLRSGVAASAAVAIAQRATRLDHHVAEAIADVERAIQALRAERWLDDPRVAIRCEYPIAGSLGPEALLGGYIDLLVLTPTELVVVDFKTDSAPAGPAEAAYPSYVKQVAIYAQLLASAGVGEGRRTRTALLFTDDGTLRWVGP